MKGLQDNELVVAIDLEQLSLDGVMTGRLPVLQAFRCPCRLLEVWRRSQPSGGPRRWSLAHVFDDVWYKGSGLGVEEGLEEPHPPLEDVRLAQEQHASLVGDELLSSRRSAAEARRSLEEFV